MVRAPLPLIQTMRALICVHVALLVMASRYGWQLLIYSVPRFPALPRFKAKTETKPVA